MAAQVVEDRWYEETTILRVGWHATQSSEKGAGALREEYFEPT